VGTVTSVVARLHERSPATTASTGPGAPTGRAAPAAPAVSSRSSLSPRPPEAALLLGVDVLVATAVATLASRPDTTAILVLGAAAVATWWLTGLFARRFALSALDDVPKLAGGVAVGLALVASVPGPGAGPLVLPAVALLAASVAGRAVSYRVLRRSRRRGRVTFPTVIVGTGRSAVALAERIARHPETGLRTVGFLDAAGTVGPDLPPVLGEPRDLARVVREHDVSDVIVAYGGVNSDNLVEILRDCHRVPVEIHIVPRFFEMHRLRGGTDQIWGFPLESANRRTFNGVSGYLKRGIDVAVSGLALLALAPVLAAVALAVRLEVGPGVFFRQVRVGLDGRPFTIRKFRSMTALPAGVESPWNVTDPTRIGPVGAFIRRYSLDEIPQLFNVLVGDMSLVGPRPERPEYFAQFRAEHSRYAHRARVPAGLTGLAAVEGLRGDTSIAERAYFDNLYIENWSLWLDLKIAARTVAAVLRGTGG